MQYLNPIDSDGDHFADLDFDEVSRGFIGRKWLGIVDYHIPYRPRTERLALFSNAIACYPDFNPATNLVDLLAGAMHWSAANEIAFDEAMNTATLHFNNETAICRSAAPPRRLNRLGQMPQAAAESRRCSPRSSRPESRIPNVQAGEGWVATAGPNAAAMPPRFCPQIVPMAFAPAKDRRKEKAASL